MELDKAVQRLIESEQIFAQLGANASKERKYKEAARLIAIAEKIREIVRSVNAGEGNFYAGLVDESEDASNLSVPREHNIIRYPQFRREGDELVKIAWSKSNNSEYEHRSPATTLHILTAELAKRYFAGQRFSMQDVLPLRDPATAQEIPDYQVYLCLAWLRKQGLIKKHGRSGYSIVESGPFLDAVKENWKKL